MKTMFAIFLLPALSLLNSCQLFHHNDDPKLPPVTTEGKDTFGCLIDGNVWLPEGSLSPGGTFVDFVTKTDTMGAVIYADNAKLKTGLAISVYDTPNLLMNKSYDLTIPGLYGKYTRSVTNHVCFYDTVLTGNVTFLNLDIKSKIIAGTFAFEVRSIDCGDTVRVTEGRFDLHY